MGEIIVIPGVVTSLKGELHPIVTVSAGPVSVVVSVVVVDSVPDSVVVSVTDSVVVVDSVPDSAVVSVTDSVVVVDSVPDSVVFSGDDSVVVTVPRIRN